MRINEIISESMLPKSAFAGSKKNKLGPAGQLKGNMKRPARIGDLVGASESVRRSKKVKTIKESDWHSGRTLDSIARDIISLLGDNPSDSAIVDAVEGEAEASGLDLAETKKLFNLVYDYYENLRPEQLDEFDFQNFKIPIHPKIIKTLKEKGHFYSQIKDYFQRLGWSWKGNGFYGYVVQPSSKEYVIKFWVDDPGYKSAIELFANNQNQPHFPKVYMYHIYDDKPTSGFAVLENLTAINSTNTIVLSMIDYLFNIRHKKNDTLENIKDEFVKYLSLRGVPRESKKFQELELYSDQLLSLYKSVEIVRNYAFTHGKRLDIHQAANFMLRGKTIVINDPYVG